MEQFDLARRLAAEALGTAALLAVVIGSGIMGDTLAGGNVAIALLGNTLPTGAILVVLILMFGPLSGAHFNPAVTLAFVLRREISPGEALLYVAAQIVGGLAGALMAHGMFDLRVYRPSCNAASHFAAARSALVFVDSLNDWYSRLPVSGSSKYISQNLRSLYCVTLTLISSCILVLP